MSDAVPILKDILSTLCEIRDSLRSGGAVAGEKSAASSSKSGQVASDRELDSEWGDPTVRKDPKRWDGPSFVGCHFSETTPEYLESLASLFDWMGDKDEESGNLHKGKPTAPYKRSDARRARGWAQRLRNGWKPAESSAAPADQPPADEASSSEPIDDLPF